MKRNSHNTSRTLTASRWTRRGQRHLWLITSKSIATWLVKRGVLVPITFELLRVGCGKTAGQIFGERRLDESQARPWEDWDSDRLKTLKEIAIADQEKKTEPQTD